ncbi:neural proliferation differentiation and control protein 1 isoform X2 [Hyla sarda]|uniref:neural proliferation differentiation and control protein 1 isoform X2 n=1 Tax=Hyla sarda TaxID=327740 RepID=UPI0024C291D7|nr:neural proliferation differentiation and control protein 1 isoform X2 [Hyla sarda]
MGGSSGSGIPVGTAVCCCLLLLAMCTGSPASLCRNSLNCPLHKREVCPHGSTECGPCIHGYQENSKGKCEEAKQVKVRGPEAVIDFLASILEKQTPPRVEFAQQVNATTSQAPPPPPPPAEGPSGRNNVPGAPRPTRRPPNDAVLLGVVVACGVAGLLALIIAGGCWCRMRKEMKLAERTDYPAYKQSPPPPYENTSPGDKKLAQNAQMYHFQHQKQQMISMDKNKELKHPDSAITSDEENEDGDFTVYECPGLAPTYKQHLQSGPLKYQTGEMEVKNPLFDDSSLHHPTNGHH